MADGSAGGLDPAGFEFGGESRVARRRRIISIGCTVIAVCAAGVSVAAAVSSRHSSPPSNVYLSLTLPTTATGTSSTGAATSSTDTASAVLPTSPAQNPPPSVSAPAPSTIVVTTANPVGPGGPQPSIRPSTRTSAPHTQPPPSSAPPPSTSAAPPPSPSPTPVGIAGELTCTSGQSIEGVWVSALVGSGYAPWQGTSANTAHYWYKLPQSESWSLHVGCGGTQQYWAVAAYSDVVTGTQVSFTCYDVAGQPNYGTCSRQ